MYCRWDGLGPRLHVLQVGWSGTETACIAGGMVWDRDCMYCRWDGLGLRLHVLQVVWSGTETACIAGGMVWD